MVKIVGKAINQTKKAVKVKIWKRPDEIWIPKSVIAKIPKPDYRSSGYQNFRIRDWFLKRKMEEQKKNELKKEKRGRENERE